MREVKFRAWDKNKMDRIRVAFKVLFTPQVIVVTRGEVFTTFNGANISQDSQHITVEVNLREEK